MVTDEDSDYALLVACDEWFGQGDVFESVPLGPSPADAMWPRTASGDGFLHPALLLTHGCALDKRSGSGAIRIERLHFIPLENVAAQSRDKQGALRRGARNIEPSEVLYLGEVPALDFEAFVVLSNLHTVPARLFDLTLVDVTGKDGEVIDRRLSGHRHDERVATLSEKHVELLKDKINVYWTRRAPDSEG